MSAAVSGLVKSDDLPLSIALHLFEIKIEAALRPTRWLWLSIPDIKSLHDDQYDVWARSLLGAQVGHCRGMVVLREMSP